MSRSAAAAAGFLTSACIGPSLSTSPEPRPSYGSSPSSIDTRWPIDRVVYVMLENRSYDNIFGRYPRANGTETGVRFGAEVPLRRCTEWLPGDLPHDTFSWYEAYNDGRMDGFAIGDFGPTWAYSQFDRSDLPNYFHWADNYALCDNTFASVPGPSYPNHLFFVAGQAGGAIDNPENIRTRRENGTVFKSWGCDAYGDDVYVHTVAADGTADTRSTCFEFDSVGAALTRQDIDWASYSANPYQAGYIWQPYSSIAEVFHDDALWAAHIWPVDDLVRDIEANALPSVTWVVPRFQLSDHPPFSSRHAHNWITDIVNSIMRSEMWPSIAIFITWDEWGGFYDHVAPPTIAGQRLGFRVPMLIVSPLARPGSIDSVPHDFCAPLRFICDNWGVPYITDRIALSGPLEHVFRFDRNPRDPRPRRPVSATNAYWEWPPDFPGWPDYPEPVDPNVRYP